MSCACACAPDVSEADFAAQDKYRQPDVVLAALGEVKDRWVADVGAGGGYFTLKLARRAGHVVATDVDPKALRELRARVTKAGLQNVETVHALPEVPCLAPPGAYHAILLSQVDHLLVNRVDYFKRLGPALAEGGVLVVVNQERYGDACERALADAGWLVERLPLPGQMLLRARLKTRSSAPP